MEEIKQLVYNYAKAIHTQNEKDFKETIGNRISKIMVI